MADVELLNTTDDLTSTEHEVTKKGLPKWLALLPIALLALALLATMNSDSDEGSALVTVPDSTVPVASDSDSLDSGSDDGGGGSFGNLRVRGNESERLGLIHGTHPYTKSVPQAGDVIGLEGPAALVLRAGDDLLVISSEEELAHRVQLPRGSSASENGDVSVALVLDKLIVADGSLLRSLSVQGGVDLVLATGLVAFQVDDPDLVLAVELSDMRFATQKVVDIRIQGVHADFFGDPVATRVADGGQVVQVDGRVFVDLGGQILVPFNNGLVPLFPGNVIAAGMNHALIRNCSAEESDPETISCVAVRARLDGTEVVSFVEPPAFGAADYVLSPTGNQMFVVADGSPSQRLLELVDGTWEEVQTFENLDVQAATFTSDGSMLVTVSDNNIVFWREGDVIETWSVDNFPPITEIASGG